MFPFDDVILAEPNASYLQSCWRLYAESQQLCSWSSLMGREALSIAFGCDLDYTEKNKDA